MRLIDHRLVDLGNRAILVLRVHVQVTLVNGVVELLIKRDRGRLSCDEEVLVDLPAYQV